MREKMKKQNYQQRKNLYELPYQIMQLERDIEDKKKEIKVMELELLKLHKKELGIKE